MPEKALSVTATAAPPMPLDFMPKPCGKYPSVAHAAEPVARTAATTVARKVLIFFMDVSW
jgi:hypothetical protein